MKNLFGNFSSGGLSQLGSILQNTLGGTSSNGGSAPQSSASLGDTLKSTLQTANLGGVSGLLGATAVGGLIGALFTGHKTKDFAKGVLKIGGAAAAGALALNFYQKWSQARDAQSAGQAAPATNSPNLGAAVVSGQAPSVNSGEDLTPGQEKITLILLEAMIYAAKADGHIDDEESAAISKVAEGLSLGESQAALVNDLLAKPVDPIKLAAKISNHDEALDLYRISCVAVKIDSYMERSYLDGLANALKLTDGEKTAIESEAIAIQESMAGQ